MRPYILLLSSLVALSAFADPSLVFDLKQEPMGSIGLQDDVILFDAPAFPNPSDTSSTLVSVQAFVYRRQMDSSHFLSNILKELGDMRLGAAKVEKRIQLLSAVPRAGKAVEVTVDGCTIDRVQTPRTSDMGIVLYTTSLGRCTRSAQLKAEVGLASDVRKRSARVFDSLDSGFGVVSDIDDTIKITNVLDTSKFLRSILVDDPKPVAGMPELYASLASSLKPQFIYVSGSPFQLYPFIHDFISTTYSASKGPIFMHNLTVTDISSLNNFLKSTEVMRYKISMIDRVHGMYPNKKFLVIGDSTQKDPETYGEIFRKYGNFVTCIWIRLVDGATNTDERFATAFAGVPSNKFRLYKDAEIPGLAKIDVAGGKC